MKTITRRKGRSTKDRDAQHTGRVDVQAGVAVRLAELLGGEHDGADGVPAARHLRRALRAGAATHTFLVFNRSS